MHDVILVATRADMAALLAGDIERFGITGETLVSFTPDAVSEKPFGGELETLTLSGSRRFRRVIYDTSTAGEMARLGEALTPFSDAVLGLLYWFDRQLRRFPRLYAWLSR